MPMGLKMGLWKSLSSKELEAYCQPCLTQPRDVLAAIYLSIYSFIHSFIIAKQ